MARTLRNSAASFLQQAVVYKVKRWSAAAASSCTRPIPQPAHLIDKWRNVLRPRTSSSRGIIVALGVEQRGSTARPLTFCDEAKGVQEMHPQLYCCKWGNRATKVSTPMMTSYYSGEAELWAILCQQCHVSVSYGRI